MSWRVVERWKPGRKYVELQQEDGPSVTLWGAAVKCPGDVTVVHVEHQGKVVAQFCTSDSEAIRLAVDLLRGSYRAMGLLERAARIYKSSRSIRLQYIEYGPETNHVS